jgi:ribonucleotide monophosphatase NagD (HAD superfamily)
VVIFKILRNAADARDRGKVCIVGRNPDAIWFNDYEDRVIFDEAGLFDYARVEKATEPVPVTIGSPGGS